MAGKVKLIKDQVFSIVAKVGGNEARAKSLRAVVPGDQKRVFNVDFHAATNLLPNQDNWFPNYYLISGQVEEIHSVKSTNPDERLTTLRVTPSSMECLGLDPSVLTDHGIEVEEVDIDSLTENSTSPVAIIYPLNEATARGLLGEGATQEEVSDLINRTNRKFLNPDGTMPVVAGQVSTPAVAKSTAQIDFV